MLPLTPSHASPRVRYQLRLEQALSAARAAEGPPAAWLEAVAGDQRWLLPAQALSGIAPIQGISRLGHGLSVVVGIARVSGQVCTLLDMQQHITKEASRLDGAKLAWGTVLKSRPGNAVRRPLCLVWKNLEGLSAPEQWKKISSRSDLFLGEWKNEETGRIALELNVDRWWEEVDKILDQK